MRIAILQSNPLIGDVFGNLRALVAAAEAKVDQADLFVTPELALLGYPARDALSLDWILADEARALEEIQAWTARTGKAFLVGHSESRGNVEGRSLHNAASLFSRGELVGTLRKSRLPSYDVFEEERHFEPWPASKPQPVLKLDSLSLGIFICEDSWDSVGAFGRNDVRRYHSMARDPRFKADLIINLSASPYARKKRPAREALIRNLARRSGRPCVYTNCAGAQDGLIFDGGAFACRADGSIQAQAALFASDTLLVDTRNLLAKSSATGGHTFDEWGELGEAMVVGIRDFVGKSGNPKVLLGLSGGIDSALVALLACRALGPKRVKGVSLPSALTSDQSRHDARDLARHLGMEFEEIPIAEAVDLHTRLAGLDVGSVAHQNVQSRNRGLLLMALANKESRMLLATGNKSEFAMGYATLYGDMCGALAPIGDLYKTEVYAVSFDQNLKARLAGREDPIPHSTLLRPPTAELAPNQKDTDSLPPYEWLDLALEGILENRGEPLAGETRDFDRMLGPRFNWRSLRRYVYSLEFKRRQAPPILRLHDRSFGSGWQMPVVKDFP